MVRFTPHQLKFMPWELSLRRNSMNCDMFTGVLSEAKVDLNPHLRENKKERKFVFVLMGWLLIMIGCAFNCQAEEKSPNLTVQSFFHYETDDESDFSFLYFRPANEIDELLESHGFSMVNSGVEYIEDYYDYFAFKTYKAKGIEVKVDVSPEEQNIVYFIEMKFDSPDVKQKFLDDSEREGLEKGEDGYFLDGDCESGIVVRLLDNNILWIYDFLI